jgi:hypothetical protein
LKECSKVAFKENKKKKGKRERREEKNKPMILLAKLLQIRVT